MNIKNIFKVKKEIDSWTVLDGLWDALYLILKSDKLEEVKHLSWKEFAEKYVSDLGDKPYFLSIALDRFHFERRFVFAKPNRGTMEHFHGDHISLYDVFGCHKHKITMTTHNDERYIEGATIFCPLCNEGIFKSNESKESYENLLEFEKCSDEKWNHELRWKKSHEEWTSKENFKYYVRKYSDVSYLKFLVWKFFNNFLGKKEK